MKIPFNKPFITGNELQNIRDAIACGHLSGNGEYTNRCQSWLVQSIGCKKALLTHSCTAALEMSAILADIRPGDEIIMPSYTFVSTANAFVLRGGVPVFVDIRPDTLNIDESKIEAAVTKKTKAIIPVHYAGVACEMDVIMAIAEKFNLLVIEDAAHGIMSRYKGRKLGSIGHLAAVSFHETKNIISGEGGALLINDPAYSERAEIIWEKGTNRKIFARGDVDKYTWTDIGSSFAPSEIIAAFLFAQVKHIDSIIEQRLKIWNTYHEVFEKYEKAHIIRRPVVPDHCTHNGHMYYLLLPDLERRTAFISHLLEKGIQAVFHYAPLDNSIGGVRYGRSNADMKITHEISERLVRLPFWIGIEDVIDRVLKHSTEVLNH